jgi:hypothetical protein
MGAQKAPTNHEAAFSHSGMQPLKWLLGACRQQHSATQVAASGLRPRSRLMPTPSPAPGSAQPAGRVSWRHAPRGACIRRMLGTTRLCERYCACADSPPQARPAVQAKRHAGSVGLWSARGAWAALAHLGYRFATSGRRMVYFLLFPLCGDSGPPMRSAAPCQLAVTADATVIYYTVAPLTPRLSVSGAGPGGFYHVPGDLLRRPPLLTGGGAAGRQRA